MPLIERRLCRDTSWRMDLFRTLLFVPAQRDSMVEKCAIYGADVVVLDLEEAVPGAEKAAARAVAMPAVGRLGKRGQATYVRVNAIGSGETRDDLLAVCRPGLAGVVLPKAGSPQDVRDLDVLLREAEMANGVRPGDVSVLTMIESPRGLLRCEEIIRATDRHVGLAIGGYDYSAQLGVKRTRDGAALVHLRYHVVTLAAAHGLIAIDTPYDDMGDDEGLRAETEFVKAIGYSGKFVVHPKQVPLVNDVFAPSAAEMAEARRIVDAYAAASAGGAGAVAVDGRMVDGPIADRARRVIEGARQAREGTSAR